jgi:hypothetical protein
VANVNLRISVKYKAGVSMAKKTKIIKSNYKPTAGDRNEAYGGYELDKDYFQTCDACPNPSSCKRAGRCMLKEFGDK